MNGNTNKKLVVFFSRVGEEFNVGKIEKGNTNVLAERIANESGADLFEIKPVVAYPDSYTECVEIASKEHESGARPEYVGDVQNFDDYKVIFIGYPIWWGSFPNIVRNFIEKHDFSGKKVIPFCTHAGSGESGTFAELQSILEGSDVCDGLSMMGSRARNEDSVEDIKNFLKGVI